MADVKTTTKNVIRKRCGTMATIHVLTSPYQSKKVGRQVNQVKRRVRFSLTLATTNTNWQINTYLKHPIESQFLEVPLVSIFPIHFLNL